MLLSEDPVSMFFPRIMIKNDRGDGGARKTHVGGVPRAKGRVSTNTRKSVGSRRFREGTWLMNSCSKAPGVRFLREGPVVTLLIEDSKTKNALSVAMIEQLSLGADRIINSPDIRAVILRCAGQRRSCPQCSNCCVLLHWRRLCN